MWGRAAWHATSPAHVTCSIIYLTWLWCKMTYIAWGSEMSRATWLREGCISYRYVLSRFKHLLPAVQNHSGTPTVKADHVFRSKQRWFKFSINDIKSKYIFFLSLFIAVRVCMEYVHAIYYHIDTSFIGAITWNMCKSGAITWNTGCPSIHVTHSGAHSSVNILSWTNIKCVLESWEDANSKYQTVDYLFSLVLVCRSLEKRVKMG